MKRLWIFGMICFFLLPITVMAEEVHIYLFYGNTCPICESERVYLETLKSKYDNIRIFEFETYDNEMNDVNMQAVKEMYHVRGSGVPFTVVGDTSVYGFDNALASRIESAIKKYSQEDYYDRVGVYLGMFEDEEIIPFTTSEISISSEPVVETQSKKKHLPLWILLFVSVVCVGVCGVFILKKRRYIEK